VSVVRQVSSSKHETWPGCPPTNGGRSRVIRPGRDRLLKPTPPGKITRDRASILGDHLSPRLVPPGLPNRQNFDEAKLILTRNEGIAFQERFRQTVCA
jgi:hypothetical protein